MTKRMREYVVHWLLLHGTDWVDYGQVNQVFYENYHLPKLESNGLTTQAIETVASVMHKGGYLTYHKSEHKIPAKWRLTEKALCKAKH